MPTGSDFALVTDKKLLGVRDFDLWMLKYLRDYTRQAVSRLFIQGSFEERMPLSSPGADMVTVDEKPTVKDYIAHDGVGHLLDLEQIDRETPFPNELGVTYEVGAAFVEYPVGIRTNPRTGKFEYDRMREGIGVQGNPDIVIVDSSTLTFAVDGLFEQGTTVGNHQGRQVRVFALLPGDVATSEAVAIETCTVYYDGGSNKITTSGFLGQTVPGDNVQLYIVQLIGLTVLSDAATNRPTENPESVFFIGTVVGNAATPDTFDISGQSVIQAQSGDLVTVDPLPNWADGTTNTETSVQAALEDIVSDLTSTTGQYGAGKITAPDRADWIDGTTNPPATVSEALAKIVTDLTDITGDGGVAGSQKVSALAPLAEWADGVAFDFLVGSVQDMLAGIVGALVSTADGRGAGKLTSPDLPVWQDGSLNPADTIAAQLTKIVGDLATDGSSKIAVQAIEAVESGHPISISFGTLQNGLGSIVSYANYALQGLKQTAEAVALQTLKPVFRNPSWTLNAIAHSTNSLGTTANLVAVGDDGSIASRVQGGQWAERTPADGFTAGWLDVANGTLGWAIVGNGGWIQTSSDTIAWTTRKFLGNNFVAVAYKSTSTATYCAVGLGGYIWTSTNLTTWTQRSLPGGATDNLVAICAGVTKDGGPFQSQIFVATTDNGKVYTSPDGITWTLRATITGTTPRFLDRMLQNTERMGYVALFTRNSNTEIGTARSDDGITWSFTTSSSAVSFDEPNTRMCLLDESIAYLMTQDDSQPYSLNAVQVKNPTSRPSYASNGQNVFDITECFPFGARNVNGTLYVVGRFNNGDGGIWAGAPFRPALGTLNP